MAAIPGVKSIDLSFVYLAYLLVVNVPRIERWRLSCREKPYGNSPPISVATDDI